MPGESLLVSQLQDAPVYGREQVWGTPETCNNLRSTRGPQNGPPNLSLLRWGVGLGGRQTLDPTSHTCIQLH